MKRNQLFGGGAARRLTLIVSMLFALTAGVFAQIQVGIVLPTKDEERWIQDKNRFEEILKTAGISADILFSEKDSAKERANVEALITRGIKVLIICPTDAAAAAASADLAHKAGVKVITYDRDITGTPNIDFFVTFDSLKVGALFAQYLISQVKGKGNNLYIYTGANSDDNGFVFFRGAWRVIQPKIADGTFRIVNSSRAVELKNKNILTRAEEAAILGQTTTMWDPNLAKSKAEANLTVASKGEKGVCYVLSPNDQTARAIGDVFARDRDVKKYYTTGQDADRASIQYIIDGKQSMTVLKDVRVLVRDAVNAAIDFLHGKAPAATKTYNNGVIDVPANPSNVITVTRENVKTAIVDSGYYPASDFKGL